MTMKYFTCLFLILPLAACAPKATNVRKKTCMDLVIQKDDALGKIRNHACEKMSLSAAINNYVNGLSQLNYDNCPRAFKTAFEKHAQSWVDITKVTDKYPELRGEMHVLFAALESGKDSLAFIPLQKNIWDTWGEIEAVLKHNN